MTGLFTGTRSLVPLQRSSNSQLDFLRGRAGPATAALVRFIDEHRDRLGGVEPICRMLTQQGWKIATSTYCVARSWSAWAR